MTILSLTNVEAEAQFLKGSSFTTIDLPSYFNFDKTLAAAKRTYGAIDAQRKEVQDLESVNHVLLTNRDGAYSWRSLQLIHPILYVQLVKMMTEQNAWDHIKARFEDFQRNDSIRCLSLDLISSSETNQKEDAITNWWISFELESIKQSLRYQYLTSTDIVDCYGSLYTHSIAWALHGKSKARKERTDKSLIGNQIDSIMMAMHYRQTNGIPQGSIVSDFIAEMVLGYADKKLGKALTKRMLSGYQVLRYRDDYRIFTNSVEDSRIIMLELTSVLASLNFRINSGKTSTSQDVITSSVKEDKLYWMSQNEREKDLIKKLHQIRALSDRHPNSGSLVKALGSFRKRIDKLYKAPKHNDVLVTMVVDIMYRNPRTYPTCVSTLSKLLSFESNDGAIRYIDRIRTKFDSVPNVGYLEIWLQRLSLPYQRGIAYAEKLCQIVDGTESELWDSSWLGKKARNAIDSAAIVDKYEIDELSPVIPMAETELFLTRYDTGD